MGEDGKADKKNEVKRLKREKSKKRFMGRQKEKSGESKETESCKKRGIVRQKERSEGLLGWLQFNHIRVYNYLLI